MPGVVVEPIDGMFLLIEGAAEAVKKYWFDREGKVVFDYRVGKDKMGDYFGEGTFLGAEDRGASIRAVGHTRVIHIDSKAFIRLRAGKVDRMMNEHYLRQLESEHKILAAMQRVEECSELYQAIEDFALHNELPVPQLATTEQLGGFKQSGSAVKAAVKSKRRSRRASVEQMERQQVEAEMAVQSVDEDTDEQNEEREKIAKSLEQSKARARRASVSFVCEDVFDAPQASQQKDAEKKGRYKGRRRSVSEWDAAGGNATDPFSTDTTGKTERSRGRRRSVSEWDSDGGDDSSSPATTPVRSPATAGRQKPQRTRTNAHLTTSSSSKHRDKDDKYRSRSHSSRHREKRSDEKNHRSSKSGENGEHGGSPKPRRRRGSTMAVLDVE